MVEIILKNKNKGHNHNHSHFGNNHHEKIHLRNNTIPNGGQEVDKIGIDLDKTDLKTLREIQNYIKQVKKKVEVEVKKW